LLATTPIQKDKEIIMRKTKGLVLSLLLISLTTAPALANRYAGDSLFKHNSERTGQVEHLIKALDLTSQQETDIKGIISESREETKSLREEAKIKKESIRSILDAEVLDEPRLRELVRKQAELHTDLMVAKHTIRARINQVLTPEQRAKHKELRSERKGLHRSTVQRKTDS
jgi:Spy/CpxP family protein refolding chaperone